MQVLPEHSRGVGSNCPRLAAERGHKGALGWDKVSTGLGTQGAPAGTAWLQGNRLLLHGTQQSAALKEGVSVEISHLPVGEEWLLLGCNPSREFCSS